MNPLFRKLLCIALVSIGYVLPSGAELTVEQVQRDYQVRYHAITGGWLVWPKCSSGESPAPHFPKDRFYGDLSTDPDKAVEVVSNLVQQFYTNHVIYADFVKPPNSLAAIEGVAAITNFSSSDMPTVLASDVTTSTWEPILATLASQMAELTVVKVQAKQVFADDASDYRVSFRTDDAPFSCEDIQNCVENAQAETPWGRLTYYSQEDCTELSSSSASDSYWPHGPWSHIGCVFESGSIDGTPSVRVTARNARGKINADLSSFPAGPGKLFLKITSVPCSESILYAWGAARNCSSVFAQTPPVGSAQDTYHSWGAPLNGGDTSLTDYIPESTNVPIALGDCEYETTVLYGWEVADAVAIVQPDFTTVPDPDTCCGTCNSGGNCEAGTTETSLSSIHVNVKLGGDNFGNSAGSIALTADLPSTNLATLAALRFTTGTGVESITDTSVPPTHLQFKTTESLADLQTNTDFKYTMSFYTAADAGSKDTNGFYQPTGFAFRTITLENPDTTSSYTHLRITTDDGNTVVTDYLYDKHTLRWTMETGNDLRKESRISTWPNPTNRIETFTVSNIANQLIYKELNFYRLFPWGQEVVTNVIDPDGAKLTNIWTYYDNAATDDGAYRQLKTEIDSNGHWASHGYDQFGRETNRVSQFLNSAVGSSPDSNRASATIYSTSAPQITVIEKLLGIETSRRYQIVNSGEVDDIQCQTPGAAINAANNLTNITQKYISGSFAGQPSRSQNPNGTVQIYLYSTNATQKTTVVLAGVPDPASSTNIIKGTITTTVTLLGGQTITNAVVSRQPGASDILVDRDTYAYLDPRLRSYTVTHLDGTVEEFDYACCGLAAQAGRDGATTSYFYDDLKRQTGSARNGITNSTILDANGAALATIRTGTDASQIIQQRQSYDLAGRVARETNALGGITVHTNYFDASHQVIKQTTYYDGGTRIETYFQDGSLKSLTGTAIFPARYEYGIEDDGTGVQSAYTKEIKLNLNGTDTSEWTKTYTDIVGRNYRTVYAAASGAPASISYFNSVGQLTNTVDPDGVSMLYTFNELGELALSVLDSNRNYTIDFVGSDRITFVTNDVTTHGSFTVRRTRSYVWSGSGSSSNLISMTENSVDGLQSWQTTYADPSTPVTSHSVIAYGDAGFRYATNFAPDGSYAVSVMRYGTNLSSATFDSINNQLSAIIFLSDPHGRPAVTIDARNGATTNWFNDADQLSSTKTPPPDGTQPAQVTTNAFSRMGRITGTLLPDNTSVFNGYNLSGLLATTLGSHSYPVSYTYDSQGRMATMQTWHKYASVGAATTTWHYDPYRGFLSGKVYDDGHGPSYTYTAAGRLATRVWARGATTTYGYNNAGDLESVSYSDSTPGYTNGFDRRGRIIETGGSISRESLTLNDAGNVLIDSFTAGPLAGFSITNGFDSFLRRTNLALLNSSTPLLHRSNGFDTASRLSSVSDGTSSAGYSCIANSALVGQIAFTNGGAQRMVTTKQYDFLSRITNITSFSASASSSSSYSYNSANQRTRRSDADGTYWAYSFDSLGQVTSGKRFWSDGWPIPGQQFEYSFDDIGNRTATKAGGDAFGLNLRSANYQANNLNQIINRYVPGYLDVSGTANSNATVTLWSSDGYSAQTYRRDKFYRGELALKNSTGAIWLTVTNLAVLNNGTNADIISAFTGSAFVPKAPENFGYDLDGNMTSDGRFSIAWDAENRATTFTSASDAPGGSKVKVDCTYDYQSRRTQKIVSIWNQSTLNYQPSTTNSFVYDGWNLIAILDHTNGILYSFTWGLDLSGTEQGAGGVGGLISMHVHSGSLAGTYFYSFDGNGNVNGLVNATDGTVAAQYEYGPFGELIRTTGPLAFENPFRFSTKFQDDETRLLYYGYRYYNSTTSTWLSRDPMEEDGGAALYALSENDVINFFDYFGMKGSGHHLVPWSIFNGAVKEEVQKFFDSDLARIFNDYYKTHGAQTLEGISAKEYNKLVNEELAKFLGKTPLKEMTLKQAEQFLQLIKDAPPKSGIAIYNNAVRREAEVAMKRALEKVAAQAAEKSLERAVAAGAKKGGPKLAKGIPLVGSVVAIYFIYDDSKVYGLGPAIINGGVDAIPIVGTGKIIGELIDGRRFLDVTVGPRTVQPSETSCGK